MFNIVMDQLTRVNAFFSLEKFLDRGGRGVLLEPNASDIEYFDIGMHWSGTIVQAVVDGCCAAAAVDCMTGVIV